MLVMVMVWLLQSVHMWRNNVQCLFVTWCF